MVSTWLVLVPVCWCAVWCDALSRWLVVIINAGCWMLSPSTHPAFFNNSTCFLAGSRSQAPYRRSNRVSSNLALVILNDKAVSVVWRGATTSWRGEATSNPRRSKPEEVWMDFWSFCWMDFGRIFDVSIWVECCKKRRHEYWNSPPVCSIRKVVSDLLATSRDKHLQDGNIAKTTLGGVISGKTWHSPWKIWPGLPKHPYIHVAQTNRVQERIVLPSPLQRFAHPQSLEATTPYLASHKTLPSRHLEVKKHIAKKYTRPEIETTKSPNTVTGRKSPRWNLEDLQSLRKKNTCSKHI